MAQGTTASPQESTLGFEAHPRVISGGDAGGEIDEHGMQHSAAHGPARDEALKRITRSHPLRDIPRMESMEPARAPDKE